MNEIDNFVICGNYTDKQKFEYIRKHICSKFKTVHYVNYAIDDDLINKWHEKVYFPDNLIVLNVSSSMQMEGFTVGHEENGKWISSENQYGYCLILETFPNKQIIIEKVRENMWATKPLYVFINISRQKAEKLYKNAEIIELGEINV